MLKFDSINTCHRGRNPDDLKMLFYMRLWMIV
nr:MAG TPA: hypothetical protein [Caudoviricetes sp.]